MRALLKLLLVEDGRVLLELPLSAREGDRAEPQDEVESLDNEAERISEMFDTLSNAGRVRMMRALFDDSDHSMAFTEMMNSLGMNPKIVSESTRRLRNAGLIEKDEDGRYRPTPEGEAQFLMASVLRRLLDIVMEL